MKTILVTGGTDGIGKGLAMDLLKKGNRVIVLGSSLKKGLDFCSEAKQFTDENKVIFLQANLSLVSENKRIIEEIKRNYDELDALVLCAQSQKYSTIYKETDEGFEFSFALYYLSRYVLSYGLKTILEKAKAPIIINVCAPGTKGSVKWDNLQYKNKYNSIKAIMHGSRLNDLLGVSFVENYPNRKIKYVLFNPVAVQTKGATQAYEQPAIRFLVNKIFKLIGKPVNEAIKPILELMERPPNLNLSAYKQKKVVSLTMETFNKDYAERLFKLTEDLLLLVEIIP
ncbi:SDR family NAD(P)-dependent oxidoreductase [Sedimentibacter sp.]|uniref:SDR family NAD(P)-dependent oxidoreductase n=1 Tax=Sedimentibacter sp. TaxID=1960295 RepID=UPI00289A6030|nr:SDR family NAD(P)-dependent oxidoreductase [Sedimentibacter sp.]